MRERYTSVNVAVISRNKTPPPSPEFILYKKHLCISLSLIITNKIFQTQTFFLRFPQRMVNCSVPSIPEAVWYLISILSRVLIILVMRFLFLLFTTESTCFSFSTKLDIRGGDLLNKARTELGPAKHGTGGEILDSLGWRL